MTLTTEPMKNNKEAASFRDPSGFIFYHNGEIYRQINQVYKEDYELLLSSGLFDRLIKKRKLITHVEEVVSSPEPSIAFKIIKPEKINFISYPYEWSFSQLKDAALLTLNIQKEALISGMCLKDASAYNVQFQDGHPILIDTLSFSRYQEGAPWIAYRQFCQHFLSPLALMVYTDIRLSELLQIYIDGIPLDLTSKLLPKSTWAKFGLLTHLHLHAKAQKNVSPDEKRENNSKGEMSKSSLIGLIENLEKTIRQLSWKPKGTDWLNYYQATNYSDDSFEEKKKIVKQMLSELKPEKVIDLGANTGVFSRLCSELNNCSVISTDIDPGAVEVNYRQTKKAKEKYLIPLVIDLTNPSPDIGWRNQERSSFLSRAKSDVVMALALIHHLAIANNIPVESIAEMLSEIANHVIIEFVPKEDSQVERMLRTRDDIFDNYSIEGFTKAFEKTFSITQQTKIPNTERVIFLLQKNHNN